MNVTEPQTSSHVSSRGSTAPRIVVGAAIADIPYALAFFQFMLVVLPYGFIGFVGSNLPYTDETAMAGFLVLLLCSGPALALMAFVLMKVQRRHNDGNGKALPEKYPALLPAVSYINTVLGIVVFFVERDGWLPDLVPVLLYFVLVLASGFLAMLGLVTRRGSRDVPAPGLPYGLAAIVIGLLYIIPATSETEGLLFVQILITIVIPPVAALERLGGRTFSITESEPAETKSPFAWCDKFLATGDGPRTFMGTAIMLLLALNLVHLIAAILYMKIPGVEYSLLSLLFFLGMGAAIIGFSIAFKNRDATVLFIITIGITIAAFVMNDLIQAFSINAISLLISGCGTGAAVTLLLRAQAARNASLHLKDFAGNRILETFFYVLLASVLGLLFNFKVSWLALEVEISGFIPVRTVFGGVVLAFAIIIFSVFSGNSRYLRDVERGAVKKKAESMEELVGGSVPTTTDPMVAAMLGGGTQPQPKKGSKNDRRERTKSTDPMVAAMLGGGTQPKKEGKAKSAEPAPQEQPPVPAKPVEVKPPERIRKIKALLLISKKVKIENVREALSLDAGTCDIVLNIWKTELGIDVASDYVDFKDIETDKILSILEAFLVEWNKPGE